MELQDLNAEAAELSAEVAPQGEPEGAEAAPAVDLAGELASLVKVAVGVLSPALPSLGRIYTDEVTQGAAAAVASVCSKHGWLQGGVMGEWGEEIAAGAVLIPLALATVQGVKADMAHLKAKAESAAPPPAPAGAGPVSVPDQPAAAGVSIGNVVPFPAGQ